MDSSLFSEIALIGAGGTSGITFAIRYLFQKIEKIEKENKERAKIERDLFSNHLATIERNSIETNRVNCENTKNHCDNEIKHLREKSEEQFATIEKMLTRMEDKLEKWNEKK